MASQFYNRYVPPSKDRPRKDVGDARACKRRRVSEDRIVQADTQSEIPERKPPKREKIKTTRSDHGNAEQVALNGQDSTQPTSDSLEAKRHKKLKRRLEKAAVASEQTNQPEAADDDNPVDSDTANGIVQNGYPTAISEPGLAPLPQPTPISVPSVSSLEALPRWLQEPKRVPVSSDQSLSELLPESMTKVLLKNGYENATPIQQGLLPMLMPGQDYYPGDVCIASSTGTGKTLAFIAPMIEALRNRPVRRLRGLVIVPTREIVSQTQILANICATKTGLQIATATGVKSISEERKLLVRKTARYDKIQWDKTAGAKFDPLQYETSDDDTSDKEYKFMQVFRGYVPQHHSKADILICTPGRLIEHLNATKGFTLDHVEWLIVDEMDRLLDQSFQDWTEIVLPALDHNPNDLSVEDAVKAGVTYIRRPRRVRKILASATVTFDPDKLAAMRLWKPRLVTLQLEQSLAKTGQFQIPPTLREVATSVQDTADKPLVLLHLLETIFTESHPRLDRRYAQPAPSLSRASEADADSSDESTSSSGSSTESTSSGSSSEDSSDPTLSITQRTGRPGVLVFTAKNENAMRLCRLLAILDPTLPVGAFTGSSKSSERRKHLAAFKRGELRVLIASNLASRSLNLTGLQYVINYDTPTSIEMYIHRVGRTARAGKAGTANTLLAHHERRWFWNEIARSEVIERQHKVERCQPPVISEAGRTRYKEALQQLGDEAQGA